MVHVVTSRLPVHDALGPIMFDIHRQLESELNWKVAYIPRGTK